MLIIETGQGVVGANSYAGLDDLAFHGDCYGYPVPVDGAVWLIRAAQEMEGMDWIGRPIHGLAWPRFDAWVGGELIPDNHIPYGIQFGQVMLAIELYAQDAGIALIEPRYAVIGGKRIQLERSNEKYRDHPPQWVASRTQFADYLAHRGLVRIK